MQSCGALQLPKTAKLQNQSQSKKTKTKPLKKTIIKPLHVTMDELSWLLTVYELAFLLFRMKEAAQVEDNGQKEHEAGHGDDRHRLLSGDGTIEAFTPESASCVNLKHQT